MKSTSLHKERLTKRSPFLVQAEEKFKELAEAYSTLSNADKRRQYDLADA